MYSQSYLDGLDSVEYEQFLFWDGQIPNNPDKPLDNGSEIDYNTPMKEFNDCEIMGDALDEYHANQEAERNEETTGMEVSELLIEIWEEDRKREASIREDPQYSEEDAFRDFISDQYEDFN